MESVLRPPLFLSSLLTRPPLGAEEAVQQNQPVLRIPRLGLPGGSGLPLLLPRDDPRPLPPLKLEPGPGPGSPKQKRLFANIFT